MASSEQLQIGIKTDDPNLGTLGMKREDVAGQSYYWCDAGAGLPAEIIKTYLEDEKVYASNKLEPVTSGSYTSGDLSLKNPLVSGTPFNSYTADTKKYVYIPLAFRIIRYNSSNVKDYAKGENIWLSDTKVQASDAEKDGEVYKAIRMFTSGQQATVNDEVLNFAPVKYLINPSDTNTSKGKTAVAGLLDISGNGYYDTYEKNGHSYNIVYGETEYETEDEILAIETVDQGDTSSATIQDFNLTGKTDELTTFSSKYFKNTLRPASFADLHAKYQNYDTIGTVKPIDDNGALSWGKPVCATDAVNGVANLDVTIWLEGWDHHVIDQENHHSFNLGLQFQISRL
ncbi:MAG: hypothetical protein E7178_03160 [Erysipelotrichaceae bacterium]|nr:hypothetical protein [Erysipelotrichaceae bacterium]